MHHFTILFIFLVCLVAIPNKSFAVHRVDRPIQTENTLSELTVEDILHATRKEKEEKIGRKLKFKERVVLWIVKKKIKKQLKKSSRAGINEARTDGFALASFVTSLFTFVAFPLGFIAIVLGIVGLIRIGQQPDKRKGRGWAILGIIIPAVTLLLFWLAFSIFFSALLGG